MTGWAIARATPLRFDPTRASGLTAAFELRVQERNGSRPLRFTLQIDEGACHVRLPAEPRIARPKASLRRTTADCTAAYHAPRAKSAFDS